MLFTKKSSISLFFIALVGSICIFSACSNNEVPQKLSELDETILIQRLTDYEVTIPANLEISTIRDAIADLEVDPDRPVPVVDWTAFADFYEELRSFVKENNSIIQ